MGARIEQYQVGQVRYPDRRHAILISPASIAALAIGVTQSIPLPYFDATAEKEAGYAINEVDTEPDGFHSYGMYQLSDAEYKSIPGNSQIRYEPWNDTRVFAILQGRRADQIHEWCKGKLARDSDLWAYLGLAHNEGPDAARKTIEKWGCDWQEYKRRNLAHAMTPEGAHDLDRVRRISAYGDACISGGSRWHEVVAAGLA